MKTHARFLVLLAFVAAIGITASAALPRTAANTIDLSGSWRLELDRNDTGIKGQWFSIKLTGKVQLPGSLPAQGIGDPVTVETKWTGGIVDRSWFTEPEYEKYRKPENVKIPFWLQPEKYYVGAAWYQRDLDIPINWRDRRIVLTLERPHWETHVWLDDQDLGIQNGLGTPHQYDLGNKILPGKHRLTIRVDNRMVVDVGPDSHSVSDHTQGNWNGIVGRVDLTTTGSTWIDDLQVYPHAETKTITVKGKLGNATGKTGSGKLTFVLSSLGEKLSSSSPIAPPPGKTIEVSWASAGGTFETEIPLGANARYWDEFSPFLYSVTATLDSSSDKKTATFGLRDFATQGTQFTLNGRKIFIRGTLECAIFPRTGHPPVDVESWKRIIGIAKAHGLNTIRFHSWCPPEAAFIAADEMGFYYQVECSSWANSSSSLGDGKPVDTWIYEEADRILKAYGNHPSFMLMPYGNEPGGAKHAAFLAKWVSHYRALDSRRLYTSGSGWPQIPENQFHVTPDPRVQGWGEGLKSRINGRPPETMTDYRSYIQARSVPVISHEIGQWCVYPNFDEMKKYTGYLKPRNFEIFQDSLKEHHMGNQARDFLYASGKLQTLCYKEDIESALRTPGMGGFQLLDLHDFPGQGTALVGVLDPFWESKGYVTAAEYSRFCNSTVPLARLAKRVFTTAETLEADIEVAHFGPAPMTNAKLAWKLVGANGRTSASGSSPIPIIPVDNGVKIGRVAIDLAKIPAPAQYKLVTSIENTPFENDWDVWVYPAEVNIAPPQDILIAHELNDEALATLNKGGRVLLTIPAERVKPDKRGKVALGFSSIFWNTAWTQHQPPHTLGILCDPKNPALAQFPTDGFSNWQWWYLINRAGAMILDDLPVTLHPTVQIIDDWVTNRKLGLIFEAKVRQGKLLVCSIDLQKEAAQNPVARQMWRSLLDYMESPQFNPSTSVTPEKIQGLMLQPSIMQRNGARVIKTDSADQAYPGELAIDGDPKTMWHTVFTSEAPGFPHEIQIAFNAPIRITGFTALPRQDNNPNGAIKDYAFYISNDGKEWGAPVAKGTFTKSADLKAVKLATPQTGRFVKLVALSGQTNGPWTSVAELEILTD